MEFCKSLASITISLAEESIGVTLFVTSNCSSNVARILVASREIYIDGGQAVTSGELGLVNATRVLGLIIGVLGLAIVADELRLPLSTRVLGPAAMTGCLKIWRQRALYR